MQNLEFIYDYFQPEPLEKDVYAYFYISFGLELNMGMSSMGAGGTGAYPVK